MPPFPIRMVSNAVLVRKGIENFGASMPKVGKLSLYELSQRIYRRLGIEGKKLPGQRYVRTGTSLSARSIEKLADGYRVIWDPTDPRGKPYGVYLRGTPFQGGTQTRIHSGRWVEYFVITNEEVKRMPPDTIARLRKLAVKEAGKATSGPLT